MADRSIKMSELKSILGRYGVRYSAKRGKGSHLLFYRVMDGGTFTYPVPTHNKDVNVAYVRGCRKKFRLRDEDGVYRQGVLRALTLRPSRRCPVSMALRDFWRARQLRRCRRSHQAKYYNESAGEPSHWPNRAN